MLLNVAPVDYERNLALYGVSAMVVPPHAIISPPGSRVDEPDSVAGKTRQPPDYEDRYRATPEVHPIAPQWRKAKPSPGPAIHQQTPPDLPGAEGVRQELAPATPLQAGIISQKVAGMYQPRAEPPPVNIELTA